MNKNGINQDSGVQKAGVPWEQQAGETDAPYSAFQVFLAQQPPRSLKATAAALSMSTSTLGKYSASFDWYARARAFDREVINAQAKKAVDKAARIREEHLAQLQSVRRIGFARVAKAGESDDDINEQLEVREASRLFLEAVKLERLTIGEATERVEQAQKWDLSKLSAEEIRTLRELKRKATTDE